MSSHRSRERLNIRVDCDQVRRLNAVEHYPVEDIATCAADPNDFHVDLFAYTILSIVLSV
jgi:hypothetical protein